MKKLIVSALAILLSMTFFSEASKAIQIWKGGCTSCTVYSTGSGYSATFSCGNNASLDCAAYNSGAGSWIVYGACTYAGVIYTSGTVYNHGTLVSDTRNPDGTHTVIFDFPTLP